MASRTATIQPERTARVGQHRQVVIPREILSNLKLRTGDLVAFTEHKHGVLLRPKRATDPDDTLSPEEARIVRRGEAQLRRGQSKPWAVVKRALPH
jgi:bifunctional DNA-binding transcriptional regulator/antitoxin component of YhaV-PrlF toxin-antitoxin module